METEPVCALTHMIIGSRVTFSREAFDNLNTQYVLLSSHKKISVISF